MSVTFLTRKYPPARGGMETFAWQLYQHLPICHRVIAVGRRSRDIVWVIPVLWWRGWRARHATQVYHLGDLVLAPVAWLLKHLTHRPVVVTVHGLELTYPSRVLRWLIDTSLPAIDQFVCVSAYTAELLRDRGVAADRISVIGHGVVPAAVTDRDRARQRLLKHIQQASASLTKQSMILLSVGRLVERKGMAWFVDQVMPQLAELDLCLIIASTGPQHQTIAGLIEQHHLGGRVQLLGSIDDDLLADCYAGTDVFVMPNLHLPHDVEGFGFVAVEAAAHGLPVLAAAVDGIPDAIHDGRNGVLLTSADANLWANTIRQWYNDPDQRRIIGDQARSYTLTSFIWEDVANRYIVLFDSLTDRHSKKSSSV